MKKYTLGVMALATIATLAVAIPAFADTTTGTTNASINASLPNGMHLGQYNGNRANGPMKPFVVGTVSAINGNTLTVVGHGGPGKMTGTTASTTYSVDATNAKVTKANVASTVSAIAVGDNVAVQGTLTGTTIVATTIRDGMMGPGVGFGKGPGGNRTGTSTPAFTGNGEPIVAGTISAINGSTISITNKSNVTYSVDTTNAKILQGNKTVDISTLKTSDAVVVQGTINGTSIVASSVIDQVKPANAGNPHPGFFGGISQFFMHLFGF